MDSKILVANFKMHKTNAELKTYFRQFPRLGRKYPHTVVFCPPFTSLDFVSRKLKAPCQLGAQDIHSYEAGAYTGGVSAAMLTQFGVQYVIVGHRERRIFNQEGNKIINAKIKTALAHGLKVILCVGEDQAAHADKETASVLTTQINTALKGVTTPEKVLIAYEPIWAIGTGRSATAAEITRAVRIIKQLCPCQILYGGSVTPANVARILALPDLAGVLVGGASLDPHQFAQICQGGTPQ